MTDKNSERPAAEACSERYQGYSSPAGGTAMHRTSRDDNSRTYWAFDDAGVSGPPPFDSPFAPPQSDRRSRQGTA